MAKLDFEGRPVPIEHGDTIASALFRAGVRIFSRSFKYHRPRGLYCLTGDCPNCLMTVDGEPCERACVTPAADGQKVTRENAWPSADFDVLSLLWHLRSLFPVGFYYKTMHRPRFIWPLVEPLIRRLAGIGTPPRDLPPRDREVCHHHPDLLVIGGGPAGLSAAIAAAEAGESVLVAEEGLIGEKIAPGPTRRQVDVLRDTVIALPNVTVLERATAIGVYEGPFVPVVGVDLVHHVHPSRVVVATGAVDRHPVFPNNDLVGIWLGRGAGRMAGAHGVSVGRAVVVQVSTEEDLRNIETLSQAGAEIVGAIVPKRLADSVPSSVRRTFHGEVVAVKGRKRVKAVVVDDGTGRKNVQCDALVVSCGLVPRDNLLRQGTGLPVTGAGDVTDPGCSVVRAMESGRQAALGTAEATTTALLPPPPLSGFMCLCEDVSVKELEDAWAEGFQSTELLKRYTTATMGPCQGAICHSHLRAFVAARTEDTGVSVPTTARPPARPVRLEDVAAGLRFAVEHRTALHERHLEMGAAMTWFGGWKRPNHYGDEIAEYRAVRENVSMMDVGTLGKFLIAGRDATEFVERLYPNHMHNIATGKQRYSILLNEAGYIFDDGLVCALGDDRYYVTLTSAGSANGEAWFWNWLQEWNLKAYPINQTAELGAINVAGPRARDLLTSVSDDPFDNDSFPFSAHREMVVAGVPCRVLRVGFVGELSYELHHPSSRSVELWDALLEAGEPMAIKPHGMQALLRLRLEKGHLVVGQDTDFDTTPAKVGLGRLPKMDKPYFVGRSALERVGGGKPETQLLPLSFAGDRAPSEGAVLLTNGRMVGHTTSSRFSPALGCGVALGWVSRIDGEFPTEVDCDGMRGVVASGPLYDPRGDKLRA